MAAGLLRRRQRRATVGGVAGGTVLAAGCSGSASGDGGRPAAKETAAGDGGRRRLGQRRWRQAWRVGDSGGRQWAARQLGMCWQRAALARPVAMASGLARRRQRRATVGGAAALNVLAAIGSGSASGDGGRPAAKETAAGDGGRRWLGQRRWRRVWRVGDSGERRFEARQLGLCWRRAALARPVAMAAGLLRRRQRRATLGCAGFSRGDGGGSGVSETAASDGGRRGSWECVGGGRLWLGQWRWRQACCEGDSGGRRWAAQARPEAMAAGLACRRQRRATVGGAATGDVLAAGCSGSASGDGCRPAANETAAGDGVRRWLGQRRWRRVWRVGDSGERRWAARQLGMCWRRRLWLGQWRWRQASCEGDSGGRRWAALARPDAMAAGLARRRQRRATVGGAAAGDVLAAGGAGSASGDGGRSGASEAAARDGGRRGSWECVGGGRLWLGQWRWRQACCEGDSGGRRWAARQLGLCWRRAALARPVAMAAGLLRRRQRRATVGGAGSARGDGGRPGASETAAGDSGRLGSWGCVGSGWRCLGQWRWLQVWRVGDSGERLREARQLGMCWRRAALARPVAMAAGLLRRRQQRATVGGAGSARGDGGGSGVSETAASDGLRRGS
ncbi:uncharacterized PE-PGRS family protein PE_PGRS54-like [Schistocerca gregaria]|uniref:uncharacterized PE-PGRS family protein PE_PGRS54-like n=1 Tax=Schistocerca gregaria TaxID=7010 RepID=UPI00211DC5B1|nr:uncharacterized PE-PGRS family protein PE_PGRS54-like [Schistocerca gregaria]